MNRGAFPTSLMYALLAWKRWGGVVSRAVVNGVRRTTYKIFYFRKETLFMYFVICEDTPPNIIGYSGRWVMAVGAGSVSPRKTRHTAIEVRWEASLLGRWGKGALSYIYNWRNRRHKCKSWLKAELTVSPFGVDAPRRSGGTLTSVSSGFES